MIRTFIADDALESALAKHLADNGISQCRVCAAGLPLRKIKSKKTAGDPAQHAAAHMHACAKLEERFGTWLMIAALEDVTLLPDDYGTRWSSIDDLLDNPAFIRARDFLMLHRDLAREAGFSVDRRVYRHDVLGYERACLLVDSTLWHITLTLATSGMPPGEMTERQDDRWSRQFFKEARAFLEETKRTLADTQDAPATENASGA